MALTLGPPTWATSSWATDAWATGSWDVDASGLDLWLLSPFGLRNRRAAAIIAKK